MAEHGKELAGWKGEGARLVLWGVAGRGWLWGGDLGYYGFCMRMEGLEWEMFCWRPREDRRDEMVYRPRGLHMAACGLREGRLWLQGELGQRTGREEKW